MTDTEMLPPSPEPLCGTEEEFSFLASYQNNDDPQASRTISREQLVLAATAVLEREANPTDGTPPINHTSLEHLFQPNEFNGSPSGVFRENATKVYLDGKLLENCTPEGTLHETVAAIRANEQFAVNIAIELLRQNPQVQKVLIQRRTVDDGGNTVGVHDNHDVTHLLPLDMEDAARDERLRRIVNMTRAAVYSSYYMTGAGLWDDKGHMYLSQKGTRAIDKSPGDRGAVHVHYSRHARGQRPERIEIRVADSNLNDGATLRRLGNVAIAIALAASPLSEQFEADVEEFTNDRGSNLATGAARNYNQPLIGPDGYFIQSAEGEYTANDELRRCVLFSQRRIDAYLSPEMSQYTGEQPASLKAIAESIREYNLLMLRVLAGESPVTALSSRADWAAKYGIVQQGMDPAHVAARAEKARLQGKPFTPPTHSQYDRAYDVIVVEQVTQDGKKTIITKKSGAGYRLRDKRKAFDYIVPQAVVDRAYYNAPATGRAARRAALIREHGPDIVWADWDGLIVNNPTGDNYGAYLGDPYQQ